GWTRMMIGVGCRQISRRWSAAKMLDSDARRGSNRAVLARAALIECAFPCWRALAHAKKQVSLWWDLAESDRWFRILNAEFDHSSDRSCAIVAASSLEELLGNLIRARFVANSSSQDTLFDGPNAPIASFSAKIDFAFRL